MVRHRLADPPFGGMSRQINKLLDQLKGNYYGFKTDEAFSPAVNLYETADAYLVCVDLAGVERDKIDLTVDHRQLRLRGRRATPLPEGTSEERQRVRVHLMEIDHGSFCRDVELPEDVRSEQINASYRDGMLWIELPKAAGG
ncbi:MAG TPA: Hsp20/alpha crystallin family protein [Tepidisphaeraceae bacterium]|nr:Hsp20/alpha crystallin family protein [Tepidisphaeraceae bacterium]